MNKETYIKINKDYLKEIPPLKIKEELSVLDMYDLVFEDAVRSYLEDFDEYDRVDLTEEEIKRIAYKLVYKDEYIWEKINETIDYYIGRILLEREKNNE